MPFHHFSRFLLVFCLGSSLAVADTGAPNVFVGTDTNWFEPTNWSTGEVPDGGTDVVISGAEVSIDPALSGGPVAVRDLFIEFGGILRTLPGAQFSYRFLSGAGGEGSFLSESSEIVGEAILGQGGPADAKMWLSSSTRRLNPSTEDVGQIAANPNATLIMALGGTIPASPGNTGAGHYATLLGDDIDLAGTLEIELVHGFSPSPGDSFQIITARNTLSGTFNGLAEGGIAARFGEVELIASYTGNAVTLSAQEATGEGEGEGVDDRPHTGDQNGNGIVELSELLRVIQFFNSQALHCADPPESTEDGYVPGANAAAQNCTPHASDYNPRDWAISLSELLRLIQFFNIGGYTPCPDAGTEDGFCPGAL